LMLTRDQRLETKNHKKTHAGISEIGIFMFRRGA
jgi:hypothetical protein